MDYRLFYDSEWLRAVDLRDKEVTLTISRVEPGEAKGAGKKKSKKMPVLTFREVEEKHKRNPKAGPLKRLGLNITNAKTIAKLYGKEVDDWLGKRITLYPTECEAFGETTDCIRIRERVPTTKERHGREEDAA